MVNKVSPCFECELCLFQSFKQYIVLWGDKEGILFHHSDCNSLIKLSVLGNHYIDSVKIGFGWHLIWHLFIPDWHCMDGSNYGIPRSGYSVCWMVALFVLLVLCVPPGAAVNCFVHCSLFSS